MTVTQPGKDPRPLKSSNRVAIVSNASCAASSASSRYGRNFAHRRSTSGRTADSRSPIACGSSARARATRSSHSCVSMPLRQIVSFFPHTGSS